VTEATHPASDLRGYLTRAFGVTTLLVFVGLITGLIEGGYLTVQQHLVHRITYASLDAVWMSPMAYALLFGLAAIPMVILASVAPRRWTTRVILGVGISLGSFSLLELWTGDMLSWITQVLLSLGVGVQLSRLLAPVADRHRRRWVVATGVLLGLLGGWVVVLAGQSRWRQPAGPYAMAATPQGAPSVLLIILDTVRAASLGLYGYERPTSPRLEEFAAGGVTFDSAYAIAPWTLPSHASMFTGLYHHDLSTDWEVPLDGAPRTLAEAFAANGYATGGFVANLLYTGRETGLARGFETYRDHKRSAEQMLLSATLFGAVRDWVAGIDRARRNQDRKDGPRVTAEFLDWLDQRRPTRFFAFLNYFDAHLPLPWVPRGSTWDSRRPPLDRYDQALAHTDAILGDLLDSLAARHALDNTLVIIASDHGELLGEHGFGGHGNTLYHPLLHVPLVVRGPGIPAGRRIGRAVSLRDLAETIRTTAGLSGAASFPGTSLQPLWTGQPVGPLSPLLGQLTKGINTSPNEPVTLGAMHSIVAGGHHYVLGGLGREELFDLRADPDEVVNLAVDEGQQGLLDALRDSLRQWKRPGWANAPEIPPPGAPAGSDP